jgi:hypothetical protein
MYEKKLEFVIVAKSNRKIEKFLKSTWMRMD